MTSSAERFVRRRQYVVNRPLQFRFVNAMILVLCAMALLAVGAVYLAVRLTLSSFELTRDPLIISLLSSVCWTIVLELLVIGPVVVWWGIRLTHRVAGPLVRIHAALSRMADGRFDEHVTLRAGDELQELAAVINRLAETLRRRR